MAIARKPTEVIPQTAQCQRKLPTASPENPRQADTLALNPEPREGCRENSSGQQGPQTVKASGEASLKTILAKKENNKNVGRRGNVKCETNRKRGGKP